MSANDGALRELAREFASLEPGLVAAVFLDARCEYDSARQMLRFLQQPPAVAAAEAPAPAPARAAPAVPSGPLKASISAKIVPVSAPVENQSRGWWPAALPIHQQPPALQPPESSQSQQQNSAADAEGFVEELFGALDRELVRAVLAAHKGNVTAAVDALLQEAFEAEREQQQQLADREKQTAELAAVYDGDVAALCELFPHLSPDAASMQLAQHQHDLPATIAFLLAQPAAPEPEPATLQRIADAADARKAEVQGRMSRVLAAGGRTWGGAPGGWASKRPAAVSYLPPALPEGAAGTGGAGAPGAAPVTLKEDMASQLKCRQLQEQFPWAQADLVADVLALHRYQLPDATAALQALFPAHVSRVRPAAPAKPPVPATAPQPLPAAELPSPPAVRSASGRAGSFTKVKKSKKKSGGAGGADEGHELTVADVAGLGADEARRLAEQCAARRTQCYRLATAAYGAGDGARAQTYAAEGRRSSQLLQALHVRLAAASLRADTASADLHGLHVGEALEVVRALLEHFGSARPGQPRPPRQLSLITGAGRHSMGGVARIRPALLEFLCDQQLSFSQPSDAVILVQLRR